MSIARKTPAFFSPERRGRTRDFDTALSGAYDALADLSRSPQKLALLGSSAVSDYSHMLDRLKLPDIRHDGITSRLRDDSDTIHFIPLRSGETILSPTENATLTPRQHENLRKKCSPWLAEHALSTVARLYAPGSFLSLDIEDDLYAKVSKYGIHLPSHGMEGSYLQTRPILMTNRTYGKFSTDPGTVLHEVTHLLQEERLDHAFHSGEDYPDLHLSDELEAHHVTALTALAPSLRDDGQRVDRIRAKYNSNSNPWRARPEIRRTLECDGISLTA
jgi:hypothetical protein